MKKVFLGLLVLLSLSVLSQNNTNQKLSVFIEDLPVDFNYVRNNVKFVDFVNDSKIADVHVIASRKSTGGGGREYSLSYYGKDFKQLSDIVLTCITYPFESSVQIREKLINTLKAGLLPYLNEKNGASNVSIIDIVNEDASTDLNEVEILSIDPWRNWVFRIGLGGGLSGEEQKSSFNYSFSFDADKITDQWKLKTEYDYYRRESEIIDIEDDIEEVIHSLTLYQNFEVGYVYSLSKNLSSGLFFQGSQSTYRNNKMAWAIMPAVQYNFFPWSEIDRRSFTVTYKIGPGHNEYYESTIYGMDKEWLWSEKLEIRLEKVETWGDLELWLEGGHYFPNFEKYYFEAGFELAFRISKGLSFTIDIQAENIHNQIYLPESELSLEDLLLNVRKPPTSFEYSSSIGISFQFGSFYNNVVNERLE